MIDPRIRAGMVPHERRRHRIARARRRSGRARFWLRFLRQRSAVIGGVIVLAVVLVALFAPWLAPHPYDATDLLNTWAPPDATICSAPTSSAATSSAA